ncbi:MAG: HlyD family efflux transporter periplasmic adaptor subunit [Acidobacteria bacterium]|nr:HlyD family efflux transporter periplasmic adaptor subunit [Acidobacteriota bacterium]
MRRWSRFAWWGLVVAAVAVVLAVALWPQTVPVDSAAVVRAPMIVTIDEEGETRIRRRFVVSAPLSGRLQRIELEPGDRVTRGTTVVARVQAEAPPLLDARSRAEAVAARDAAQASVGRARAEAQRAVNALNLARRELDRERELDKGGLTTRQAVEQREADVRAAEDAVRAANFAVGTATSEVQRADARLQPDRLDAGGRVLNVVAPIDGVVLRRLRESASVVPAGEPLVEIGDPQDLEIVSDLLSTDAVQVKAGAVVRLEQWGGDRTLQARVRRVEPSGFMKISALGVEEQRVNVLIDFDDAGSAAATLGDGYRAEVRIVTWQADDVVQVPVSALFRQRDAWAVYVMTPDGRVRLTPVTIGHRNAQMAEALSGVSPGDVVVAHPPDTLSDGARARARSDR